MVITSTEDQCYRNNQNTVLQTYTQIPFARLYYITNEVDFMILYKMRYFADMVQNFSEICS